MRRTLRAYGDWLRRELGGGARGAFARYRRARQSLCTSISPQSRHALDWTNFFLADVQTGFGAFVAFYLADLGWTKGQVGLALTAGTLAALSQIPGGALVDALRWKRALAASGIGKGQPTVAQQGMAGTAGTSDKMDQADKALERARALDRQGKEAECMDSVRQAKELAGSR